MKIFFQVELFMHCLLTSSLKCVFCLQQNRARHTLNAIGHCIVWFVFDVQISLRSKIQSLSLLWSLCKNFRPLAEAKCHAVWQMIVPSIFLKLFNLEENFDILKYNVRVTRGHRAYTLTRVSIHLNLKIWKTPCYVFND